MATAAPAAPTPGVSAAGPASIDAAPDGVPEHTQLALAKLRLMEAAGAIRPLQPLRDHPWTTVATAAGVGAVLGSATGGGAILSVSALVRSLAAVIKSLASLATPLAGIVGPFIAGKVAANNAGDAAADAVADAPENASANAI